MYNFNNDSGTYVESHYPVLTSGKRDGHGGNAVEHKMMMEAIANEIVDQKLKAAIPDIMQEAYSNAYQQFCQDLTFDVTAAVQIAFANGQSIFNDSRTQKVVAENIMKEIKKQFDGRRFKINV